MSTPLEPHDLEKYLTKMPLSSAPDDLWEAIQSELGSAVHKKRVPLLKRPVRSPMLSAAAILIAVFGGTYVGTLRAFDAPGRWEVVPVAGAPQVADGVLNQPGTIGLGQWLVTDDQSRAVVSVGRIGTAEVGPNSRLRLDSSRGREHRLTLARGSLDAIIAAPPRLFFVATPAALATDLGCAYRLSVDANGTTRIHVTSGWVELEEGGRVSLVPEGLVASVEMGGAPGTPHVLGLSIAGQQALRRLDRGTGETDALLQLLRELEATDYGNQRRKDRAITLWHLLQRLDGDMRSLVLDSMIMLSPPPEGVTREGILALNRPMLDRWRRDLRPMWSEEALPPWVRLARRLWEWTTE